MGALFWRILAQKIRKFGIPAYAVSQTIHTFHLELAMFLYVGWKIVGSFFDSENFMWQEIYGGIFAAQEENIFLTTCLFYFIFE